MAARLRPMEGDGIINIQANPILREQLWFGAV
jgi:hypothetical protein